VSHVDEHNGAVAERHDESSPRTSVALTHSPRDYGYTMKWLIGTAGGLIALLLGGATLLSYVAPTRAEYQAHVQESAVSTTRTDAVITAIQKDVKQTHGAVKKLRKQQRADSENLRRLLARFDVQPAPSETETSAPAVAPVDDLGDDIDDHGEED
jgi:hypothetical protein